MSPTHSQLAPESPAAPQRNSRWAHTLQATLLAIGELLMPVDCPCGEPDVSLCEACKEAVGGETWRCDRQATALRSRKPPLITFAGARYEGSLRRIILDYKDAGRLHLAKDLSEPLAGAIMALIDYVESPGAGSIYLVPVPVRWSARLRRGDDHVMNVLRPAARNVAARQNSRSPIAMRVLDVLTVSNSRRSQKGAGLIDRSSARRSRVRCRWSLRWLGSMLGRPVLLAGVRCIVVDDVVTSGATLLAVVEALEQQGAEVIGAACVAATPRH